jgi:hypothetical protein
MAEIKISELTANGANLQTTDRIPTAVDDGLGGFVTRYVTGDEVIGAVSKTTVPVRNQSGATIYKGTIVYISSAAGNKLLISKSLANSEATSARTLGVVTADIANNTNGNVQSSGILTNLDTRSSATHPFTSVTLAEGDTLYLDPTTAGYVTNVKPLAPSHLVYIGKVISASPTTGEILYQIQNGFELYEIHDVAITSVANNDLIQYDSATSLWKNRTLSTAGIQPTLVSGTNIKTINSTSILGSGNIAISSGLTVGTTAITSGTVGRILFEGTGNLVQEDAALFWDNTNKRLGIGATPDTSTRLDVRAQGALSTDVAFRVRNSANTFNAVEVLGNQQFNITQSDSTIGNKSFVIKNPTGTNDNLAWNNGGWLIASNAANRYSLLSSPTTTGVLPLEIQHSAGNRLSMYVDTNSTLFKMETNGAGNANEISMLGGNIHRVLTNATLLMTLGYSATTNSPVLALWKSGNFSFFGSGQSLGAGAFTGTNVIRLNSGTAPTDNPTDSICFYSSDIVAGNSAPHFRTENGNIIKLYQQPTGGAASTFVVGVGTAVTDASTFDGYTLGQVVKALRNTGILA